MRFQNAHLKIALSAVWFQAFAASAALAHELWLEPEQFSIPTGDPIVGDIRNGQNFEGVSLIYLPRRIARYEVYQGSESKDIEMRQGDRPGLNTMPMGNGLNGVIYVSTPSTITYESWEKFASFADHKALPYSREAHEARGFDAENFTEEYVRYSKTLVMVGSGDGEDRKMGMKHEFTLLNNVFDEVVEKEVELILTLDDARRMNAQVEVFERSPEGDVAVFLTQTDETGRATIPVKAGYDYQLDSVYLEEVDGERPNGIAYRTHWANLTFHVANGEAAE